MFGPCFRVCRHLASDAAPKQAFSWAAAETEAKDASVSLVITSVRARCRACATETEATMRLWLLELRRLEFRLGSRQ